MDKEERKNKVENLKPMDKVRYNLGLIKQLQFSGFMTVFSFSFMILGVLLLLPLIWVYGKYVTFFALTLAGFLCMTLAAILPWIVVFKIYKFEKQVDEFLIEHTKKEK